MAWNIKCLGYNSCLFVFFPATKKPRIEYTPLKKSHGHITNLYRKKKKKPKTKTKNSGGFGHLSITTQRQCQICMQVPTESYDIEIPLILQNTKIFYQNSHLHCIYNGHVNNLSLGSWLINKLLTRERPKNKTNKPKKKGLERKNNRR